jgi:hypothetical protein
MKKLILSFFTFMLVTAASAQYYYVPYTNAGKNPGNLNKDAEYPVGGGIAAGWSNILAGNQATPVWSNRQKLPFTFNFNGNNFDSFYVSTSGVVTFSRTVGTAPAYANNVLPDASIPDNSACIRGILTAGSNSAYANIVTKTFGASGSRQFYITFSAYNELNLGAAAYMWVSIMLEEGSNNIYFIDQRKYPTTATKLTMGVQVNSTTANMVAGSPNVNLTSTSAASEADNSYYRFIQGTQPAYNAEGVTNSTPDYLALTQLPFTIKGVFKNLGTSAITSCDINYSINGGAAVTVPITVSIAQYATASISSTATWTASATGTYTVDVWLSNINGNADGDQSNDKASKSVIVVDDYVVRMPLHEVFTSSTCPPCRPGNQNIDENIFPLYTNQYAVIKYQMSFPGTGDPYTTAEGKARQSLYNVTDIPNMQVDGGWNGNANIYSTALFDQYKSKPAFIKIESSHTINFKKITVNVKVTPLADYNNANMKVFVAILEKKTENNVKSNLETEFFHVLKKMLPNANGTDLGAVTKNTPKTFPTFTYNQPGKYRLPTDGQTANIINLATEHSIEELQDCEVVVFIQDLVTKEVFQAANSVGTVLSVDDVNATEDAIAIFPNPSKGISTIRFNLNNTNGVVVNVYNSLGQVVKSFDAAQLTNGSNNLSVDTEALASGIYTVKIEGNGFTATQKFVVE